MHIIWKWFMHVRYRVWSAFCIEVFVKLKLVFSKRRFNEITTSESIITPEKKRSNRKPQNVITLI